MYSTLVDDHAACVLVEQYSVQQGPVNMHIRLKYKTLDVPMYQLMMARGHKGHAVTAVQDAHLVFNEDA